MRNRKDITRLQARLLMTDDKNFPERNDAIDILEWITTYLDMVESEIHNQQLNIETFDDFIKNVMMSEFELPAILDGTKK